MEDFFSKSTGTIVLALLTAILTVVVPGHLKMFFEVMVFLILIRLLYQVPWVQNYKLALGIPSTAGCIDDRRSHWI